MSTARDAPWRGMAAIAVLAYAACDLLHEAAHVAAAWLPVGVRSVTISTVGVSSFGESAIVSLAGPLANLVLGSTLWLMRSHALPATARYATWLFGSINGFNATAYLLYSALLGGGDWATVWRAVSLPAWRPLTGLAGVLLYAAAVAASLSALRRLVADGVLSVPQAQRACTLSYGVGGAVLVAGSLLNPVSPWLIVTSGLATGFGAMAGLLVLPRLLERRGPATAPPAGATLQVSPGWIGAGALAGAVFIGVFGPGVGLGP
jgi:hypothetical protein